MKNINEYYAALGLKPGASFDEIKEAYKDLIKVWHPDRFAHDPKLQAKAHEKLKEINEAFQKLQEFLNHLNDYQQATGTTDETQYDIYETSQANTKQSANQSAGSTEKKYRDSGQKPSKSTSENRSTYRHNPSQKRLKPLFSSPNFLSIIFFLISLIYYVAKIDFSWTPEHIAYMLGKGFGVMLIPFIFFMIYNLQRGESKRWKAISTAVSSIFLIISVPYYLGVYDQSELNRYSRTTTQPTPEPKPTDSLSPQSRYVFIDETSSSPPVQARGSVIEREDNRFIIYSLVVIDKMSGLMWVRDANLPTKEVNWGQAKDFIFSLNESHYAGFSDWRLPDKAELETLTIYAQRLGYGYDGSDAQKNKTIAVALNKAGFINVIPYFYWTANTSETYIGGSVAVGMWNGNIGANDRDKGGHILPVRNGT